jgi:hypothetical protein
MEDILNACNEVYTNIPCCHIDGRKCYCYDCIQPGFYQSPTPDTYACIKKLCYYIMNYGPAFASETYHYLSESKILDMNFAGRSLKVLSLGCGFSPDLIALEKYISDNNLNIQLTYVGLDNSALWSNLRRNSLNAQYCDATFFRGLVSQSLI